MSSRTVQVTAADRTLFHVAARELRQATAAVRIAQLSGVHDPWLDAAVAILTIPDVAGIDTGGLPAPGTISP